MMKSASFDVPAFTDSYGIDAVQYIISIRINFNAIAYVSPIVTFFLVNQLTMLHVLAFATHIL